MKMEDERLLMKTRLEGLAMKAELGWLIKTRLEELLMKTEVGLLVKTDRSLSIINIY